MGIHPKFLFGIALSSFLTVSAQAQDVRTGDALICASAGDARDYAATHQDKVQTAIDSETDGKSCLVAKIAFVAGKQTDRLQQNDATYIVTEILVVAINTPYGYLKIHPSVAYTLLKLQEERA